MRHHALAIAILAVAAPAATASHACPLAKGEPGEVAIGIERGAVQLEGGARLVPPGAVMPTPLSSEPLARAAADAAFQRLKGRRLILADAGEDRHGRLPAEGTLAEAPQIDLAVALVEAGAAFADPAGRPRCAEALLAAERRARAARHGLWAVDGAVLAATNGTALRQRSGLFAVAEGWVERARLTGDTLYVNFSGLRDQTLVAVLAGKSRDGLDPAMLAGTLIRVRGMVNGEAGPLLAVGRHGLELITGRRKEGAR